MTRAVVLDLDGTLLTTEKRISARNEAAVEQCMRQGWHVIFATARPPRTVRRFLPHSWLEQAACIYYNGALLTDPVRGYSRHTPLAAALVAELVEAALANEAGVQLAIEVEDQWYCIDADQFAHNVHHEPRPQVIGVEQLKTYAATKLLLTGSVDGPQFQARFGDQVQMYVTDGGSLIQIGARDASKEAAVAYVLEHCGIDPAHVICFGDDTNDCGLFQLCGWSVAMGNAIPDLKQAASEVTLTNDEDGVAHTLERLLQELVQ